MAAPLAFWFDFSSPYGYLAAQRIEKLAARHGRGVDWHPMLLGVAFKADVTAPHTTASATPRGVAATNSR